MGHIHAKDYLFVNWTGKICTGCLLIFGEICLLDSFGGVEFYIVDMIWISKILFHIF